MTTPPRPVQLGMSEQMALWGSFWSDLLQGTFSYTRGSLGPRMADPVFEASELKLCLVGPAKVFQQEAECEEEASRGPGLPVASCWSYSCGPFPPPWWSTSSFCLGCVCWFRTEKGLGGRRGPDEARRWLLGWDVKAERRSLRSFLGTPHVKNGDTRQPRTL